MSEVYYKVIHHKGGLSVAEMQDFDELDYRLASREKFDDEAVAVRYGKELAENNGLQFFGEENLPLLD